MFEEDNIIVQPTEQGMPQPIHIGDVVCAIIERDGSFLVAQRPEGKSLALKWEFPGGKVEEGEPALEALHREIREELGVEPKYARLDDGIAASLAAQHEASG